MTMKQEDIGSFQATLLETVNARILGVLALSQLHLLVTGMKPMDTLVGLSLRDQERCFLRVLLTGDVQPMHISCALRRHSNVTCRAGSNSG